LLNIICSCGQSVLIDKSIGMEELMHVGFEIRTTGNDDIELRCRSCDEKITFKESE